MSDQQAQVVGDLGSGGDVGHCTWRLIPFPFEADLRDLLNLGLGQAKSVSGRQVEEHKQAGVKPWIGDNLVDQFAHACVVGVSTHRHREVRQIECRRELHAVEQ